MSLIELLNGIKKEIIKNVSNMKRKNVGIYEKKINKYKEKYRNVRNKILAHRDDEMFVEIRHKISDKEKRYLFQKINIKDVLTFSGEVEKYMRLIKGETPLQFSEILSDKQGNKIHKLYIPLDYSKIKFQ
ncbi:MAG: hypothetical protein HY919_07500 [Elusimicrobia bacterium]|nr:hypothetical protein [Elusimicrobiota bacterium]